MLTDRVGSFKDFEKVVTHRKEDSTVKLVQVLCDVFVKELTKSYSDLATQTVTVEVKEQQPQVDPNTALIQSIEAQSKRIAFLNKQISEAMLSTKPLLSQINKSYQ